MVRIKYTNETFDKELKEKNPNIIRVGEYVNFHTPIKFKCLVHNQIHIVRPDNILTRKRLKCCGLEILKQTNLARNKTCREEYDKKLSIVNSKITRVGDYVNSSSKIEHKCLIHNQIHLATPNKMLSGRRLYCCRKKYVEDLSLVIKRSNNKPCSIYTFQLANFSEHVKFGISNNIEKRSRDPHYGDLISSYTLDTRLYAFVVEQACLNHTKKYANCPEELVINKWVGHTEVRKLSPTSAEQILDNYTKELKTLGVKEFSFKYLDLTFSEKNLLDKL